MTDDTQKKIFSANLNRYIKKSGKTQKQISKDLGINPQTVNSWCRGIALPRMGKVQMLADYFGISKTDLIEDRHGKNQTVNASRIPVLGRVRCGIPLDAIEDVIDYEEVPEKMNYDGKLFGLRVKGDSMYPPIRDGDTLIVHEQPDAETNEIVIAMVNGCEATCKELKKIDDGIMLVPWNRDYDAMFFSWQQVQELPVRIVGKVVEFRSKV